MCRSGIHLWSLFKHPFRSCRSRLDKRGKFVLWLVEANALQYGHLHRCYTAWESQRHSSGPHVCKYRWSWRHACEVCLPIASFRELEFVHLLSSTFWWRLFASCRLHLPLLWPRKNLEETKEVCATNCVSGLLAHHSIGWSKAESKLF